MKANDEVVHVEPTPDALRPRPGVRVYVRDLPTPPEVAEAVAVCSKSPIKGGETRQEVEERFKVDYYYGGKLVLYVQTSRGIAVIATEDMPQEEYEATKAELTPAERARLIVYGASEWNVGFI